PPKSDGLAEKRANSLRSDKHASFSAIPSDFGASYTGGTSKTYRYGQRLKHRGADRRLTIGD
ncbi:hypothetical protein, partial [Lacisediminimonas profundi]|uniref:hypothetical protein n=1 Tax=Lacisediminimonas profundi TaxID=2603856 RepID=UPI0019D6A657